MQEFLNPSLKPYINLTREEKHILLDAVIDECLQYYSRLTDTWCDKYETTLGGDYIYRTKPKEYKKLNVPWNVIDEKWKYTAMDDDNELYLFTEHPTWRNGFWSDLTDNGDAVCVDKVFKLDTTGIVAEHSLTQRPEGV